jgi:hypothetical protein
MGLQAEQIADIVTVVQDVERPKTYTLLTTEFTEYVAMRRLMKKKRSYRGGEQLSFQVMVGKNDSARTDSLYRERDVSQADLFKKGRVPWRHVTNHYLFDEREPELNSQASDLADIVKGRRTDCFVGLATKFEEWFWETPTGLEASDDAPPFGVKYWIQRTNTDTTGDFQGGDPAGFAAGCAGLSSGDYPNWDNYSVGYAEVSEDDFVKRLRKAATKTNFINPVTVPDGAGEGRYGYYTNYAVFDVLCDIAKARNDNLGYDLAAQRPLFKRTAIEYVPYLDDDTENPFYGIDWSVFKPVFQRGEWMNEITVKRPGKQPRCVVIYVDSTLNYECKNRRKLFVLYAV